MTSMEPPAAAALGVSRREITTSGNGHYPLPRANEDEIASAFVNKHAHELRFCHDWGKWLKWDDCRWQRDEHRLAFHYARQCAREANIDRKAGPAKASTASGVERFAQADPRLATSSKDWTKIDGCWPHPAAPLT